MNTKPIDEPLTFSIDISEVCKHYPDECEFCDYNHSGWCSLYCIESLKRELALVRKENASLKAEIPQLQADNRSLVEQMNAMALKPNQAIIERHEYDHDNPETYPAKRGFYICESASGKIELFWSPLAQEWYITEVHDKVYNHFQINAYYTWVKAPKGVTNE